MYDIYMIKAGDSISSLANKFSTTASVLRELNPNSSFGVGSNIVVPTTREYFDVYVIEKGDNLYEYYFRFKRKTNEVMG